MSDGPVIFEDGHDSNSRDFCWDVSVWEPIFYKQMQLPVDICDTTFETICKDKTKEVIHVAYKWDLLFYPSATFDLILTLLFS